MISAYVSFSETVDRLLSGAGAGTGGNAFICGRNSLGHGQKITKNRHERLPAALTCWNKIKDSFFGNLKGEKLK